MRDALSRDKLKRIYTHIAKRYDVQHALITVGADRRGRKMLVDRVVGDGQRILDCGAGTGTTAVMAARKTGPAGRVTLFDLSDAMLAVAREKIRQAGLSDRVVFQAGDMVHLPFPDNCFDAVFSTYSLCPLYDPQKGALELYRVTRPGGTIAVAHSTEPRNFMLRWLSNRVEDVAWRLPWLSMGCRSVNVLPALQEAGGRPVFSRLIGVPLWPFQVFIVEKPATG